MTGKQFRLLMVLTVVSSFLGGAASNLLLRGAPAVAQAGAPVYDVVKAKQFDVVDDAGKTRAVLSTLPDGSPGLALLDATGEKRGWLGAGPYGSSGLVLYDAAGKKRASLNIAANGAASLALWDAAVKMRTALSVRPDGSPCLVLADAAGQITWCTP